MQNEHYDLRKDEIVKACEKLYDEYNFKEITIKLISEKTTFSRPSIYNYFETKEEIFLELFKREYDLWNIDLKNLYDKNDKLSKEQFSSLLAHTIEKRERLLRLLSTNLYDLEENCRMERLIDFKKSYGNAIHTVKICVGKFFKTKSEDDLMQFLYSFFPFMFGIYPYAKVTEKQSIAMKEAGIKYKKYSIYNLAYMEIYKLLS